MGASGWQYTVPYEVDVQVALDRLRAATFASGEYLWLGEGEWVEPGEEQPRPETLERLLANDDVRSEGTHSIIDCPRVVVSLPADDIGWSSYEYHGSVIPVTKGELAKAVVTDRPGIQHLQTLEEKVARARWVGRCTVLYDEAGEPELLAFWGHSGD